jgi:hypothetical protein
MELYQMRWSLFVIHGVKANVAVIPVNTINGPYADPYAKRALPFQPSPPRMASLIGPQMTFPIPLPAESNPKILPRSLVTLTLLSSFTVPAYVEVKPPAKKPYRRANMIRVGREVEKPQRRKMEKAEPSAEIKTTCVTLRRSQSAESNTTPGTEAVFRSDTVREPVKGVKPRVRA